jgi:hypothetical protein
MYIRHVHVYMVGAASLRCRFLLIYERKEAESFDVITGHTLNHALLSFLDCC